MNGSIKALFKPLFKTLGCAPFVAIALSGCAVGPDYHAPSPTANDKMPAAWRAENSSLFVLGQPSDAAAKGKWWTVFGDDELNKLQNVAEANNQTLVIAAERLTQARLRLHSADAAQLPQMTAGVSDQRFKTSVDRPLSAYHTPNQSTVQNNPQVGFAVSYEADIFGRVQRNIDSAQANAQQAQADVENAKLVLQAELAANYFKLRELDIEIALLQKNLSYQQKAFDFVQARYQTATASGLDMAQQKAVLENVKAQLTQ